MSSSDNSENDNSEASKRKEKSPAFSPRKHRRTSPPRHLPPFVGNVIPRPRFSSILSEDEQAIQQLEMHRRNLPLLRGPDPGMPLPMTMLIEQKLAVQHLEIQRLLNDNQQLAVTHVSLRQQVAALQDQLQHRRDISLTETEKDEQIKTLVERVSKQEVDLRAMQSLKDDLEKLLVQRQELSLKAQADALQIATLKSQIDGLHNELQNARIAYEQERKVSANHLLHKQAMEKSYHSVLEEVGRLRMELADLDAKTRGVPTGAVYGSAPLQSFSTDNGMQQKPWEYPTQHYMPGVSFQDPMLGINRQPYYTNSNFLQAGLSNGQIGVQDQLVQVTNDSTAGKQWSVQMASNGQHFYYNAVTGATQWEKPPSMASEDQYHLNTQIQHEKPQHPIQFSENQEQVLEPYQSSSSAQINTHAHYTQVAGQVPHAGVPGKILHTVEQASARTASQS